MQKKLWSGRFTAATEARVDQYTASIYFDHELFYEDILGSLAHIAMLTHCHILNANELNVLQQGLKHILKQFAQGELTFRVEDEDIHMNIERLLSERVDTNVAAKLHTARSRNDQVALDLHLYMRKKIIVIADLLISIEEAFMQLAKNHIDVIMPGYTHLQRAQPIYFAEHCLAYIGMFQRDITRLKNSWQQVNLSPLGACALAGTTIPIDKNYVANQLGFDGCYSSSMDAVSDRDFIVDCMAICSLIMMHFSRLSEELILWSSQEFNFIQLDDAYCTGSSIMPQKKNPDIPELARGKTGRVYGALLALLTTLKGLPLTYNKDLQEDKVGLFDTIKTVIETLIIYKPLLTTMKINAEQMQQAVKHGYMNATALAEYLVKQGMAFRDAHAAVGKMVALSISKNCALEDLPLHEIKQFYAHVNNDVYEILKPNNIVAAYQGANPKGTLKSCEEQLKEDKMWVSDKRKLLETVYAQFDVPLIW